MAVPPSHAAREGETLVALGREELRGTASQQLYAETKPAAALTEVPPALHSTKTLLPLAPTVYIRVHSWTPQWLQ